MYSIIIYLTQPNGQQWIQKGQCSELVKFLTL